MIVLPHPILDDGTLSSWRESHPHRESFNSIESAKSSMSEPGLFSSAPDVEISSEEFTAPAVREFISRCTDRDILFIVKNKPRANFSKDGIDVHDLSSPGFDRIEQFADSVGVNRKVARKIYESNDSQVSTISMIVQMSFLEGGIHGYKPGDLYDVSPGDNPPWDITNSIVSGDVPGAYKALKVHMSKYRKKSDITSLSFQLIGYMRKVSVSGDDVANVSGGSGFFLKNYRKIKDLDGLVDDLSWYSSRVIQSSTPDIVLSSMVCSMASRF